MQNLLDVTTIPLKKLVNLLFSLEIGNTNLGSIIVVGFVFVVLIGAIMHFSGPGPFRIIRRIRSRDNGE